MDDFLAKRERRYDAGKLIITAVALLALMLFLLFGRITDTWNGIVSVCGGIASVAAVIGAVASLIVIWRKKQKLAGRYDHFDIDRIGGKEIPPENKQIIQGGFLLEADWFCFLTSHGRIRHVHEDESKRVIKGYWASNFWATELQIYWGDPNSPDKQPPDEYIAARKPNPHNKGISLARKSEGVYEGYYVKASRERLTRIQKTKEPFPVPEERTPH